MLRNFFVGAIVLAATVISVYSLATGPETVVLMRQPIASIEIGRTQDGKEVRRQFYFGLAVTRLNDAYAKHTGLCAGNAVAAAVQSATTALDSIPDFGEIHKATNKAAAEYENLLKGRPFSERNELARARYLQEVNERTDAAVKSTRQALVTSQSAAEKTFSLCVSKAKVPVGATPTAKLVMTSSTCWENDPVRDSSCVKSLLGIRSDSKAFTRVSKMLPVLGGFATAADGMQVEVASDGALTASSYSLGLRLKPEPTIAELTVMVVRAAELARKNRQVLDAAVATLSPLARMDVLHTPEVFNFPALAYESAREAAREVLVQMDDEFARTRIAECAKVRGVVDLAAASDCTGYKLDIGAFEECLGGGKCRPDLGSKVRVEMLLNEFPLSGKDLLTSWAAPRMNLGAQLKDYETAGKKCQEKKLDAPAATLCLTRELAGPKERATLDCAQAALNKSDAARAEALKDCVTSQVAGFEGISQCMKSAHKDGLMTCAVVAGLSKQDQKKAECLFNEKKSVTEKAVCVAGVDGSAAELLRAQKCLEGTNKDHMGTAVCIMGDRLPKEAQAVYECAQQLSTWEAGVGCVVSQNIGGDAGRLARCAIASGGDVGATAACAVGPQLTPEQQIALQCAMQSPDLTTFAVCTGGQLTLREYTKCKDKKFGENECFGPDNELRKFSRNVLGMDIHEGTVVGQALNLQLDVIKGQVALLEAGVAALSDAANAIGSFAQGLGDALSRAAQSLDEAARSACGDLCGNWRLSAPRIGVETDIGGIHISF